jgi:hypothetical protein
MERRWRSFSNICFFPGIPSVCPYYALGWWTLWPRRRRSWCAFSFAASKLSKSGSGSPPGSKFDVQCSMFGVRWPPFGGGLTPMMLACGSGSAPALLRGGLWQWQVICHLQRHAGGVLTRPHAGKPRSARPQPTFKQRLTQTTPRGYVTVALPGSQAIPKLSRGSCTALAKRFQSACTALIPLLRLDCTALVRLLYDSCTALPRLFTMGMWPGLPLISAAVSR